MRRKADSRFLRSRSLALALALLILPAIATEGSVAEAAPGSDSTAEGSRGRGSWSGLQTTIGAPTLQATEMTYSRSLGKMVLFGASEADDIITYDPKDSKFRNAPTYSAPSARYQHRIVTDEESGRIVLFGGSSSFGPSHRDTWTFDPLTNTWENRTTDISPEGRAQHAMSYAGSGRVLLFSGVSSQLGTGSADTWIHDVAKNEWLQLAPTISPGARSNAAMAWLGDDRVLLFGGMSLTPPQQWLNDAWVFDLGKLEWSEVTPSIGPGQLSPPRLLFDGSSSRVVLLGAPNAYPTQLEVWTVSLDALQWTRSISASGQLSIQQFTAGVSDEGTVVVVGPSQKYPSTLTEIRHLNPKTMSWQKVPADFSPASCPWQSVGFHRERGSAYMVGFCSDGQTRMFEYLRGAQAWVPFQSNSPVLASQYGLPPMSAGLEDGLLIYAGGPEHETWRFSSASGTWRRWTAIVGPDLYYGGILAEANDGKLLMFGGYATTGTMSDQSWIYDLESNSWSESTSAPRPPKRVWAGAAFDDRSDRVILFGGYDDIQPTLPHLLGDTWAFDVRTHRWTEVTQPPAPSPRFVPTLSQMGPGGPVVLFGGLDETQQAFADTWHFDGNLWQKMDPVQSPRPRGLGRPVWDQVVKRLLLYGGFAGGSWSTETWQYSTRTPVVVATTPSSGASSVAPEATIRVEFDMPMDFTKMLGEVRFVPAITGATGTGSGKVFDIAHGEPLRPDTAYQVSISPRVVSEDGIPMGEWYNFSFRTGTGGAITINDIFRALPWALGVAAIGLITGAVIWRLRKGKSIRERARDTQRKLTEAAPSIQGRQIGGAAALARKRAAVRRVAENARRRSGR